MGNQLNCLAQCQARQEGAQRLLVLQKGAYFMRKKTILGMNTGTERIHVKLDEDGHTLLWKLHDSIKNPTKIELHTVNLIQAQGKIGFTIISQKGDTLLDVEADSEEIRDTWVTHLQMVCEDSNPDDETEEEVQSGLKFRKMVEDRAKKQAYWAKRTQELEQRKQEAEERKKKFAGVGMKYTALAMANRPDPSSKD
ncbi:hypothetical protein F441_00867 [Phytophthora nicotianae CJ01A1]|uniref:PH domain-containing protein n=4 Tax=Phytophthora nicotianae TaxID=4792 RepID=W2HMN0_PHYNI|nr:hypothetical protein L915_00832 [Phytophthora nicotianae]ETL49844.1 hypothetical protein L916_00822 [Phytophthora nicotianae]ETP26494.1 hypothetical protein F441_00867 [Phytophthora nicotianae CJ01A1]